MDLRQRCCFSITDPVAAEVDLDHGAVIVNIEPGHLHLQGL